MTESGRGGTSCSTESDWSNPRLAKESFLSLGQNDKKSKRDGMSTYLSSSKIGRFSQGQTMRLKSIWTNVEHFEEVVGYNIERGTVRS